MSIDLSYETLREQVLVILRKRILSGVYKPGERMKELAIAKELNISRGPVREALRQIEQEGLVSYVRNKGCTVKTITPKEIFEIYLVRGALEILAVKISIDNIDDSVIKELEICSDRMGAMSEENNLYGIVENDEEFHSILVRQAGVKLLYETWKSFEGSNAAVYYTMYDSNIIPVSVKDNHLIIVQALKEKDLDKACSLIQEHYMIASEDLYNHKKINKDKILKANILL